MALSRTNLLGQISGTSGNYGASAFVTSTFTPPDASLLVVAVAGIENGGSDPFLTDLTIAGGGLTYTNRIDRSAGTAFSTGMRIYTAPVTTGASMALTVDCGPRGMGFYAVSVVAYTGYDTSSPVGATASGFQVGGFTGPPDPVSLTLSGTPGATSEVFSAVAADRAPNPGVTPGTGWTELDDLHNSSWGGLQSQIRTSSTSTSVAWADIRAGGGSLFNFAAVALEIKAKATVAGTGVANLGGIVATGIGKRTVHGTGTATLGGIVGAGHGTVTSHTTSGSNVASGWYGLVDIYSEARDLAAEERTRQPAACPNDGEPLTAGPNGELFCRFDGWIWSGVNR